MSDETWQQRHAAAIRTRDDLAAEAKAAAVSTYGPDMESWSSEEWTQVIIVALDMLGHEQRRSLADAISVAGRYREALERIRVGGFTCMQDSARQMQDIAADALTGDGPPVATVTNILRRWLAWRQDARITDPSLVADTEAALSTPAAAPLPSVHGMLPGQRCTLAAGHRVDFPHEHYADVERSWEADHTRLLPRCPFVAPRLPKETPHE